MFSLPRSMAPSCLVFAAALPKGRRYLPGQGLAVPVAQLPGSRPRTPMGSLRSSGDPSRAFAPFPDPGRTGMPSPSRSHRCCPRFAHSEGFGRWLISGLTGAASAPAVLRFVFRIAAHTQGSLPAGRLGLCREGVEPSGPLREVSARVDDHPPSCSPDASAIRFAIAPYGLIRPRYHLTDHPVSTASDRCIALRRWLVYLFPHRSVRRRLVASAPVRTIEGLGDRYDDLRE